MGGLCCPILSCPLYKRGTCKSSTESTGIHRFPINNVKIRELWEKFVSEQNGVPFKSKKKHGLCTAHFGAKWMMPSGRITRDAIPTIAPLSTKKVLCKWNLENSRLVPIAVGDVFQEAASSPVEANSECARAAENVSPMSGADNVRESVEDDIADNLSSTGEINFLEDFNIEENISSSPAFSSLINTTAETEELNTVEKVENAIRQEKAEALKRYRASVKKIKDLKILLNQLKESGPALAVSPILPVKKIPTSPISSMLKSSIQVPIPSPSLIGSASIGDNGLPPPLFEDYN